MLPIVPTAEPTAERAPADDLTARLAGLLRSARLDRGLSTAALAQRSGVSRATVVKLERAESQPSAGLLGRLCAPLGMTLSELFARAEDAGSRGGRLVRADEQPVWTDPATGYLRRTVSPLAGGPLELAEIELPARARVGYPAASYAGIHQQVWVLAGRLELHEGPEVHRLGPGDCLELGPALDCTFANPGPEPTRYLVAVTRRR